MKSVLAVNNFIFTIAEQFTVYIFDTNMPHSFISQPWQGLCLTVEKTPLN